MDAAFRLVVGLGNPDSSYRWTRHNVGRDFLDHVAQESKKSFARSRQAEILHLPAFFQETAGDTVTLVKLSCYMNESGPALRGVLSSEKVDLKETLVLVDDFMIPFGSLRLRSKGSSGGHNGLNSIIETFGTEEFARFRIGVGPVPEREDPADFVLEKFSKAERDQFPKVFEAITAGLITLQKEGFSKAMNLVNKTHV